MSGKRAAFIARSSEWKWKLLSDATGSDGFAVIMEKGHPVPRCVFRTRLPSRQTARDGALRNDETELQEPAVDLRSAPCEILSRHRWTVSKGSPPILWHGFGTVSSGRRDTGACNGQRQGVGKKQRDTLRHPVKRFEVLAGAIPWGFKSPPHQRFRSIEAVPRGAAFVVLRALSLRALPSAKLCYTDGKQAPKENACAIRRSLTLPRARSSAG